MRHLKRKIRLGKRRFTKFKRQNTLAYSVKVKGRGQKSFITSSKEKEEAEAVCKE
jgi:hypothetical protein